MSEHIDGDTSDGFHTFNELYDHRQALTAALFKALDGCRSGIFPWRSRLHHDGQPPFGGGWFIVGVDLPIVGQITYHYQDEHWSAFDILGVVTVPRAPQWDGADSNEVARRLAKWSLM